MEPAMINQLVDFAASLYPVGYDRNTAGPGFGHPDYQCIQAKWSDLKLR